MKIINFYKIGFLAIITFPFKFIKYFLIGIKSLFLSLPLYIIYKISKNKQQLSKAILTLSICTYLLSIFLLTRWYVQNERTKKFADSIYNQKIITITKNKTNEYLDESKQSLSNKTNTTNISNLNYINVNLDYYINKNSNTIGWIKINDTNINYPIVQAKDNKYYLKHDFYKNKSETGWIFADYRNNFQTLDNNTIIYGHNLINNTMFGEIPNFLKSSWLKKENKPYIRVSTIHHNTIWEIFSIYKTKPVTDYLQTNFNSIENYTNFLNTLTNKSVYNFNVKTNPTDKIITLSTCDDTGKYRVVVHAKLINISTKQ